MGAEQDRAALVRSLQRQVQELSAELSATRAELSEVLGGVQARLDKLEEVVGASPDRRRPPPPRCWLWPEGPARQPETPGQLVEWLEHVYVHYAPLPACWLFHPAVVEELFALAQAHWRAYYGPERAVQYASYWTNHERPDTAKRIDACTDKCERRRLTDHPGYASPGAPLADFAHQLTGAWPDSHTVPAPTDEHRAALQSRKQPPA